MQVTEDNLLDASSYLGDLLLKRRKCCCVFLITVNEKYIMNFCLVMHVCIFKYVVVKLTVDKYEYYVYMQ